MTAHTLCLNTATLQLLAVAVTLPCLARKMHLTRSRAEGLEPSLHYQRNVPWLREQGGELAFDPDKFYRCIGPWSSGERACALFLLNVWNPGAAARRPARRFDLFDFIGTCGSGSAETKAVIAWMQHPVWP